MKWVSMKGEGKIVFKSKLKWVGLVGLVLSALSLFTHFLLARYTDEGISEYQSAITIFSWRPIFENADLSTTKPLYRRLWGPVRRLESLHPHANPRGNYAVPVSQTNGFIFIRIRGGFHEIRNSISDVVVISRLLNATLVIPEIQSTTSSKGISSEFKSFAYLYNEDQFMAALAKDVKIVKTLPKILKGARRKKEIPTFKVPNSVSPYFYLHHVLPVLNRHSVVELVVSDGGCLQAILPPHLEEYQRLRCRVAFHALMFRQEVQELATKILSRLRAPRRPFIAYDPGMTRDALAYYGCAELFQDVHSELIQHRRSWMLKHGIVKGNLTVNSAEQRLTGSCPLMPEEVGIILRAYGYSRDTVIYVSGGEVFGGQKKLIPLHAMFENVVDRTSLTTAWELNKIYGREANLVDKYPRTPPSVKEEMKFEAWKTSGPRPRPLPPPPARPKSYNIEGWWGWVAESDNEPETTVMELRTNAHKLLWEAIDYTICVEADVFIPGFDRDGKGHPNFASLVMGHRLYQSAASKTYRLDRKEVAKHIEEIRDHLYVANRTWITSVRKHLRRNLIDGLAEESTNSKSLSFLSFPAPECSCLRSEPSEASNHASSPPSTPSQFAADLGVTHPCPSWMNNSFNHLKFTVLVHKYEETNVAGVMGTGDSTEMIPTVGNSGSNIPGYMVVGFEVIPCSFQHNVESMKNLKMYGKYPSGIKCDPTTVAMAINENEPVAFSYEVSFVESDIKWPSRWDAYLKMEGAKVHWFSILNSLMVITFLAGIVLVIFLRTVRRDLTRYEELDKEAQAQMNEELSGWKLVVGDVFRAPSNPSLLCIMVGDGVQILGMAVVTIMFAALGFMSPASRGTLITGMLFFYMILGIAAGYVAVRMWRTIFVGDHKGWVSVSWRAACFFPGIAFLILTTLNFLLWGSQSTGAIPFSLFVILILLWFCISVPLTLVGGYFGAKAPHIEFPVRTNQIPREIPAQKYPSWLLVLGAGTLPFGTLFIELFFIMSSIWLGRVYYVFGFLFVVLILLVVVCAEVSLVLTYMHLCVEDWKWWWKSFFASGSVAIYIFLYSINYLVFDLKSLSGPVSAILYLGYSLFMVIAIMLATGTVGFLSSFWFVHYLFSSVKLD